MKQLAKEDLKDLQELAESRTIDQIKTLRSTNKSHSNLLESIKSKASKSSIKIDNPDLSLADNPDSNESIDKITSESSLFD
jgi:hypothetical protein